MKKLYALSLLMLGMTGTALAQCMITSGPTITPSGLSISVTATGTGATQPTYVWDWGDSSTPGNLQNDNHTYASAGTYTVCVYYADQANPFTCIDSACASVTVSVVGISEVNNGVNSISSSPNPFGASTTFNVNLAQNGDVKIAVYDVMGKKVEMVTDEVMSAGTHKIVWTPENLAEGVYFVQMEVEGQVITKRIVHTTNK